MDKQMVVKKDFEPHYVLTSPAGRVLVLYPDSRAGWALSDGEHYWAKGSPDIMKDRVWIDLSPTDSRITPDMHDAMDCCIPGLDIKWDPEWLKGLARAKLDEMLLDAAARAAELA